MVVVLDCPSDETLGGVRRATISVIYGRFGIQSDSLIEILNGAVKSALLEVDDATVSIGFCIIGI